jgi:hypothetical protein
MQEFGSVPERFLTVPGISDYSGAGCNHDRIPHPGHDLLPEHPFAVGRLWT